MGYLEWSNEICIVSISGQKLAEVMFYWSKFGGILKLIKKSQNYDYDTFFVKFETTPWTVPDCWPYTLKVTVDKGQPET